jgi:hypothetical protein
VCRCNYLRSQSKKEESEPNPSIQVLRPLRKKKEKNKKKKRLAAEKQAEYHHSESERVLLF